MFPLPMYPIDVSLQTGAYIGYPCRKLHMYVVTAQLVPLTIHLTYSTVQSPS